MFHLLNKKLNLQLVILLLLAVWAGWTIFARMTLIPPEGTMMLFHWVAKAWNWSHVLMRIIVLCIMLTITFGVIHEFQQNHFSESRTYLPGIFLLLMLNCGKFLYTFSPALLTTFFIALLMIIYSPTETTTKIKDRIFIFGLVSGIATMLDISAFGVVLFLLTTIIVNNVTPFKDGLILLFGLLFTYIYAFSIAFISNTMPSYLQSWSDLSTLVPIKQFTHLTVIQYIILSFFVIMIVYLIIRGKQLLDSKLIVIRQAYNNTHLLFFSMLLFLWLGNIPLLDVLVYLLPPVSIYMSVAAIPKRRRYVFDLIIVAFCVLLCL